jgi:hypothetical protein
MIINIQDPLTPEMLTFSALAGRDHFLMDNILLRIGQQHR